MEQQQQTELLIRIDERLNDLNDKVESIDNRLYAVEKRLFIGNGTPALESRVTAVEAKVGEHRGCPYKRDRLRALYAIASAIAVAAAAVLLEHAGTVARALGWK